MRITLKRDWFAPGGQRLRMRDNPHEVPDEWEKVLPEGAEEVKEPKETKAPAVKPKE